MSTKNMANTARMMTPKTASEFANFKERIDWPHFRFGLRCLAVGDV